MRNTSLFLIFALLLTGFTLSAKQINIMDRGVDSKGKELCTKQIQKAINELSDNGGGELYFPNGQYLCGSIFLKSGVIINLDAGAVLLGSQNVSDYKAIKPDFVALRTQRKTRQLIFAEGQKNIGIIGNGTINGQGSAFEFQYSGDEGVERPHGIQLIDCENIRIENIFMTASGAWMQHYLACKNLHIKGLTIYNHSNRNNDGIDIDGCENVTISDCIVDSDDDGICLKSTSPAVCENVTITNCVVSTHCNALKLGTESTGGFRNITFNNCVIKPSIDTVPIYGRRVGRSAISVEMVDGGILEYVNISNITVAKVETPIFIRLGNRARKYYPDAEEPGRGILRHVSISNVIAYSESPITCSITGLPENYAENILLSNIQLVLNTNGTKEMANREIPEAAKKYPQSKMFGESLPASSFYIRHVKNLLMDNIMITLLGDDERPAFVADDVVNSTIEVGQIMGLKNGVPVSKIVNSNNTVIEME